MKKLIITNDIKANSKLAKEILTEHHNNDAILSLRIFGPTKRIEGCITKIDDDMFCIGSNTKHYRFGYGDVLEYAVL